MPLCNDDIQNIQDTLSHERFLTYLNATRHNSLDAVLLYKWNIEISSALTVPLHFFEIANRNAILKVIIQVYGINWYESEGFRTALTNPTGQFYNPRNDLISVVRKLRNDNVLSSGNK